MLNSGRLQDFVNNPQRFIEEVAKLINYVRANKCIDGITYTKIPGKSYSFTELFDLENQTETTAFLDKNAVAARHSLYDHIVYDNSQNERDLPTRKTKKKRFWKELSHAKKRNGFSKKFKEKIKFF